MKSDFHSTGFQSAIEDLLIRLTRRPAKPDREFLYQGTTIGEVHVMAGQILSVLSKSKKPVQRICLAVENKALIAAAILASLSGGPPLLLPYAVSDRALAGIHKQGLLGTVLTEHPHNSLSLPSEVDVLSLAELTKATPLELTSQCSPEAERVHIYTGGTTGAPQVWSKTWENVFGEGLFLQQSFSVHSDDTILATVPPYHIYGLLFSVILPLVSSAPVIPANPSFPGEIVRTVKESAVTILASVPPHYRGLATKSLGLRLAFSSAGMLAEDDNLHFCEKNPAGIVEVYGSTETGGIATRNRSQGEEAFTPFSTIDWQVDQGCLAIRSPFISPELPLDSNGYFITNDRVEAESQTQFRLKGRVDSVIKVGGKRVDLDEIRTCIRKQDNVEDCVVLSFSDSGGRGTWFGALIQGSVALESLRQALAAQLEPYALPRRMHIVDAIPTRPSGKHDRDAIRTLLQG